MSIAIVVLLVLHGAIHLLGVAKAFSMANLPQLTQEISRPMGIVWLIAAVLLLLAAVAYIVAPRVWWALGIAGVVVSQIAIVNSWSDARFGTIANLIILAAAIYGMLSQGPGSFQAAFEHESDALFAHTSQPALLTETDMAHLPRIVQRYVRESGAVGRPRVRNFHVAFKGRIRSGPDKPWMSFTADQYSFIAEPARLFLMHARMSGLPLQAYHRALGPDATMQAKALALKTVVNASGPEMGQAESVTMLNDICIMAPGALVDPRISWEETGERTVRATFFNDPHRVSADLVFNDRAQLVNFVSDDRFQSSPDGKTMTRNRWSTPLSQYHSFAGGIRAAARGEARWSEENEDWTYAEMKLVTVEYNVRRR